MDLFFKKIRLVRPSSWSDLDKVWSVASMYSPAPGCLKILKIPPNVYHPRQATEQGPQDKPLSSNVIKDFKAASHLVLKIRHFTEFFLKNPDNS